MIIYEKVCLSILASIASRTLPPTELLHTRILSRSGVISKIAALGAPYGRHKLVVAHHLFRIPIAATSPCRH